MRTNRNNRLCDGSRFIMRLRRKAAASQYRAECDPRGVNYISNIEAGHCFGSFSPFSLLASLIL
jgi:hypothetical protein